MWAGKVILGSAAFFHSRAMPKRLRGHTEAISHCSTWPITSTRNLNLGILFEPLKDTYFSIKANSKFGE